ncbi:NAD(P)-dependent oxidoreductase [Paenibacillus chungangensis]|uniref:NAD(P)-dependent oxidoreductase n=1 Tax=Paenibacillus chungangensis TaxID=696535 RepID=A0ABW3HVZ7_9BACL
MKLFVAGATGKTGQIVIRMALQKGHQVTAFVRSPDKLKPHDRLTVIPGNVTSADHLSAAMSGHDAVISCLGTEGTGPSTFLSDTAEALTTAMLVNRIDRIGYVASAGIHGEIDGIFGKLIMRVLRNVLQDHARAVKSLQDSGLAYTVARPMGLTDKPGKGEWRIAIEGLPSRPGRSIAREDVAAFILDAVENERYLHKSVAIAY